MAGFELPSLLGLVTTCRQGWERGWARTKGLQSEDEGPAADEGQVAPLR